MNPRREARFGSSAHPFVVCSRVSLSSPEFNPPPPTPPPSLPLLPPFLSPWSCPLVRVVWAPSTPSPTPKIPTPTARGPVSALYCELQTSAHTERTGCCDARCPHLVRRGAWELRTAAPAPCRSLCAPLRPLLLLPLRDPISRASRHRKAPPPPRPPPPPRRPPAQPILRRGAPCNSLSRHHAQHYTT